MMFENVFTIPGEYIQYTPEIFIGLPENILVYSNFFGCNMAHIKLDQNQLLESTPIKMVIKLVHFSEKKSVLLCHFQEILSLNWVKESVKLFESNCLTKNKVVRNQDNIEVFKRKKLSLFGTKFIFEKDKVVQISDKISKLILEKKECCIK